MSKIKIQINRQDAVELTGIVNNTVIAMQNYPTGRPLDNMMLSVLRDCVAPRIAGKLIVPAPIKGISFKEFEAEAVKIAVQNYEINTSDIYQISLIERIKNQLR
jgi:hypothetical protein